MRCTLLCGVHPPVFSPPPGTYASAQSVVITSSTGGATIRYTTDGAAPSDTAGTIYQGPVTIVANTTLKAIACKTGMANSPIVSGAYSLRCATPTFSPGGGTHQSSVQVRISSATTGAAIRYTTDGSTPSASSQRYTAPITLIRSCTVKAVAMLDGCLASDVATAVFDVLPGRIII
ncbi:MAG TPA: chitobiase/beta-hexosaminidase C-terminal domain-containing protein, partial [Planctomycetota bacterium]|nr:chitobiase/beta-hexosaminidase C-terminal domain-containing protein [Planctomycetota bacterium]